jgi:hypothetical protein
MTTTPEVPAMPRDTSKLDAAVLAHRADPTDANRERVLAAMRDHVDTVHRTVIAETLADHDDAETTRSFHVGNGRTVRFGTPQAVVWTAERGWLDAETAHAHETGPKLDTVDDAVYPGDYDGLTGRI